MKTNKLILSIALSAIGLFGFSQIQKAANIQVSTSLALPTYTTASLPTTATDGMLIYNSTTENAMVRAGGAWVAVGTDAGGASNLNDLDDVTSSGATSGQVLSWNGSNWEPADDNDTVFDISSTSVDALNDVDTSTTAPTDGQVLTWVAANSAWEPTTVSGGGGAFGSFTEIDISAGGTFDLADDIAFNLINGPVFGSVTVNLPTGLSAGTTIAIINNNPTTGITTNALSIQPGVATNSAKSFVYDGANWWPL